MKKGMKKILKYLGIIVLIVLVLLLAYIIYLFASYHRIPDNQPLQVEQTKESISSGDTLTTEKEYSALTYNIGFGAYTPDFSFFMDGGKSSWAKSKESVKKTVQSAGELVIFLLHMSAYGNSDAIREGQIRMLSQDMQKEYEAGNYVLCGGDFNHDLKASNDDNDDAADHESWAYPFPREALPEHFSLCIDQLSDTERNALWDSARNADMEYTPGETYTVTLDGFIISDNIECLQYENVNTGYSYSDHDPVYMKFKLLDN